MPRIRIAILAVNQWQAIFLTTHWPDLLEEEFSCLLGGQRFEGRNSESARQRDRERFRTPDLETELSEFDAHLSEYDEPEYSSEMGGDGPVEAGMSDLPILKRQLNSDEADGGVRAKTQSGEVEHLDNVEKASADQPEISNLHVIGHQANPEETDEGDRSTSQSEEDEHIDDAEKAGVDKPSSPELPVIEQQASPEETRDEAPVTMQPEEEGTPDSAQKTSLDATGLSQPPDVESPEKSEEVRQEVFSTAQPVKDQHPGNVEEDGVGELSGSAPEYNHEHAAGKSADSESTPSMRTNTPSKSNRRRSGVGEETDEESPQSDPYVDQRFSISAQNIVGMEDGEVQAVEIYLRPLDLQGLEKASTQELIVRANLRKETIELDLIALSCLTKVSANLATKKLFINLSPYSLCTKKNLEQLIGLLNFLLESGKEVAIEINNSVIELTGDEYVNLYANCMKLARKGINFATNPYYRATDVSAHVDKKHTPYLKIARPLMLKALSSEETLNALKRDALIARFEQRILIGEGAENEKEYLFYKSLGCDWVQGYYIARPELLLNEGFKPSELCID